MQILFCFLFLIHEQPVILLQDKIIIIIFFCLPKGYPAYLAYLI